MAATTTKAASARSTTLIRQQRRPLPGPTVAPVSNNAALVPQANRSDLRFEYPDDARYFAARLCRLGETIDEYYFHFDFRAKPEKRREFDRAKRRLIGAYEGEYGRVCQLQIATEGCSFERGLVLDHLIPLESNELNKRIRGMAHEVGRKVPQQSLGSNDPRNLVLACARCNSRKLNSIPNARLFREALARRGEPPTRATGRGGDAR